MNFYKSLETRFILVFVELLFKNGNVYNHPNMVHYEVPASSNALMIGTSGDNNALSNVGEDDELEMVTQEEEPSIIYNKLIILP